MLFEDINCLNELIRLIRTDTQPYGKATGRFRDLQVHSSSWSCSSYYRTRKLISFIAHPHLKQILLEHLN
jgi:hypothetical protein